MAAAPGRPARVTVVGAGLSGVACARELVAAGVDVRIVERGRAPGGRMASPELHGRRTDLGAAYFTVQDDGFGALVRGWLDRGLVREWTDTFAVISKDGRGTTTGPMRFATPDGLRSLVRDLLPEPVSVTYEQTVGSIDELPDADAVVLAMPDPQARRLLPADADVDLVEWVDYDPVISVAAGWDRPAWLPFDAAFVNDDADIALVADDGARRGDGAAVLVVHSTSDRARRHLDDPQSAASLLVHAARKALPIADEASWFHAHRWTFAKPASHRDEPYGLLTHRGRPIGLCNDAWCPRGAPRIESAWLAGSDLGRTLAHRLG